MLWPVIYSNGLHSCSLPYVFSFLTGVIANGTLTIAKVMERLYLDAVYFEIQSVSKRALQL